MGKAEHQQSSLGSYSTLISFTELANSGSGPPVTPGSPPRLWGLLPHGHPCTNLQPYTTPCRRKQDGEAPTATPRAMAWVLLFSSPCTSPGRFRQGELLPAQPGPREHSPAHTRGSTGPGQTPIAGKNQKRLISFPFSPSPGVPQCLPSSPVYPAFCWRATGAVPGTGSPSPGAAGAQTPTAEAAARAAVMQPVAST